MTSSAFVASDTPAEVQARMVQHWRAMSARDRLDCVAALNESCDRMAEAGVRARYPLADEHELRLRTLALRLGRDLMVRVYGWDPDVEGW